MRIAAGTTIAIALCAAPASAIASVDGWMVGMDFGGGIQVPADDGEGTGLLDVGFRVEKSWHSGDSGMVPFVEVTGLPMNGQQYSARAGTILGSHGSACELWLPTSRSVVGNMVTTTYSMIGTYECVRGLEVAVAAFVSDRNVDPVLEVGFGRAGPGHAFLGARYNPVRDQWGARASWMVWGSETTGFAGGFTVEGMFLDGGMRVPLWAGISIGYGGGTR
jgi:hypothetical protein